MEWDERYTETPNRFGLEPNDFLVEAAARIPRGGSVLSMGEGEGRNAVYLASLGHDVTALDASRVGMEHTAELARARGLTVSTIVADLGEHDLGDAEWDAIVSVWVHLPPELRRRVHAGVVRSLKPGGVFILEAYTPAQLGRGTGGPSDVELLMTLDGLRDELEGLDLEIGRETERLISEGETHSGISAVVQIVGREPSL